MEAKPTKTVSVALENLITTSDSTIRTNTDELISITEELAAVVKSVCLQIKGLKEEREEATGDTQNAYNLVIKNKVWTLQTLIGSYWRQTLGLELDS